jgi:starch-binding outer membrane protein, SusD/RagB family
MKKHLIKNICIAVVAALGFLATGCEDYVKGVSEFDPTLPQDASVGQVINAAEVGLIGFVEGDIARLAGIFTDQFSGADRQYVSLSSYVVTALDFDSQWGNIYANVFKSTRIAQAKARELNNVRALGLAQFLEAYVMGMTAALFGDIPYREAINLQEHPNPAYDPQRQVYADVLALLDQAITNFTNPPAGTSYAGDLFGGDDATWIARANTLKAKYYLHLGQYDLAAAAAAAGISNPGQDIWAMHGTSYGQNYNIYYSFLTYDRSGYMTADNALAPALLDPLNPLYRGNAKTNEGGRFFAYYYPGGLNSAVDEYDINVLSANEPGFSWQVDPAGSEDGFFAVDAPFPILTFAENQLILAEARLRAGNQNGALDALNAWRAVLATGYRINAAWQAEGLRYDPYVIADFESGGVANTEGLGTNDALYKEII